MMKDSEMLEAIVSTYLDDMPRLDYQDYQSLQEQEAWMLTHGLDTIELHKDDAPQALEQALMYECLDTLQIIAWRRYKRRG